MPGVGDELLGFRLIGELGSGAFGRVFLARQGDLADRPVALKISPEVADEPRTLAQLQHTNIVPIYSVHRLDSLQVVCMPYFGSTTLLDVCQSLRAQGMMPASGLGLVSTLYARDEGGGGRGGDPGPSRPAPASTPDGAALRSRVGTSTDTLRYLEGLTYVQAVLWVVSRLAAGLEHAHERGILHHDLKPANVLVTDEGQPMILDFNLARDLKVIPASAAAIGGTLPYMSPEQLEAFRGGDAPVDARSDLYSLGIIFFELLAGRRPFENVGGSPDEVIDRMIEDRRDPIPDVRLWNPAVSPAVESILRQSLQADPDRRYQDARQFIDDLERQLTHRKLKHARDPSPGERLAKWARRHPTLSSTTTLLVLASVLATALGAAGWAMARELERASAKVHRADFRAIFDESQFLLTISGGPTRQLERGVRLAERALRGYFAEGAGGRLSDRLSLPLPVEERKALREELSELIQLMVRARVQLAERAQSAPSRIRAMGEGVEWLDLAEQIDPHPPASLYRDRAYYHEVLGRREHAGSDRERAAIIAPTTARDHYLLGVGLLVDKRPGLAEEPLSRAIVIDSSRFCAWFALATCHFDQGRYSDAASEFGVCSALVPTFAWPLLNRGLALARAGRLAEARVAYDQCLHIDSGLVEALVDRALVLLELDEPKLALKDLDDAVALKWRTATVLVARAEALAKLGDRAAAARAFDEAVAVDPDDPMPLVARGFARLDEDPRRAKADFDRALKLRPRLARALLGRALLLRETSPRVALRQAEQALAADPELWDALQLKALLRARLGDPGAEDDVAQLLRVPTAHRLYNAACAFAQLSKTTRNPRLVPRAIDLLRRALESGIPREQPGNDRDLEHLRGNPAFRSLLQEYGRPR